MLACKNHGTWRAFVRPSGFAVRSTRIPTRVFESLEERSGRKTLPEESPTSPQFGSLQALQHFYFKKLKEFLPRNRNRSLRIYFLFQLACSLQNYNLNFLMQSNWSLWIRIGWIVRFVFIWVKFQGPSRVLVCQRTRGEAGANFRRSEVCFFVYPPARKVGERISRGARVVRTERTDEASINSEYVTEIRETNVHMYARVKQKRNWHRHDLNVHIPRPTNDFITLQ